MTLLRLLINGLSLGSIYGLTAFGFVAVFKTNRILNFAHAPIAAVGALAMASALSDGAFGIRRFRGLNPLGQLDHQTTRWLVSLLIGIAVAGLLGAAVEHLAIRPMRGRSNFIVTTVTIGVSIVVQILADQAPIGRRISAPWGTANVSIGGEWIAVSTLAAIAAAPVVLLGLSRIDRTRFGIAIRALAADEEAAVAQGINREALAALAWALAAALGTLAAVAFTFPPVGQGALSTASLPALFFRAIPVLALGGWDSYRGAYLAGLLIGLLQVLAGGLLAEFTPILGAGYSTVLPYLVMLAVLMSRPAGLFGQPAIRRV